MKRIVTLIICMTLLLVVANVPTSAENNAAVTGLYECMNKVLWSGSNNTEVKFKIETEYSKELDRLAEMVPTYPDYAIMKMGLNPSSAIPLDQQIKEEFALDYEKGLLISSLNTVKYLDEYARTGCFSYVLNNKILGIANASRMGYKKYSIEGNHLLENEIGSSIIIDDGMFDYLKNTNNIETALSGIGETIVYDASLFGMGYLTFLYIQGENNEYLIRLCDFDSRIIPEIKPYEIYTAAEVMNAFNDPEVQKSIYSQSLAEWILEVKPTFSAEAESLQAEGLLKGNENGLDLLKPLTRIEAATMLLRAMGKDETAEVGQVQTFSDVPNTHWGFGAAENAYNLGLVKGVGDDMFAPDESVTAEQFATMILRAGKEPEFNWEEAINIMIDKGIISQENAATMDFFTRGDMAKIIYEARQNGLL